MEASPAREDFPHNGSGNFGWHAGIALAHPLSVRRWATVFFGQRVARTLSGAMFRSGNAEGTDAALVEGVASVNPARMHYVLTRMPAGQGAP